MNTCKYQITLYSYTPKKKVLTLEERKEAFRKRLKKWSIDNPDQSAKYPNWMKKDWFDYWTELANDNGRKMRFEMESTWNTGRRLATAKKTIYAKDPRWDEQKKVYTPPKKKNIDYGRIDYSKRKNQDQPISEIMGAGERLKKGWS